MSINKSQKSIYNVLKKNANKISDILLNNIPKLSGELSKNTKTYLTQKSDNEYVIVVNTLQYFDYLNEGVNGKEISHNSRFTFKKGPKVEYIIDWAKAKGINPYAVRNSIWRKGLKPRHFFDSNKIDKIINNITDDLAETQWETIVETFTENK